MPPQSIGVVKCLPILSVDMPRWSVEAAVSKELPTDYCLAAEASFLLRLSTSSITHLMSCLIWLATSSLLVMAV